MNLTVQRAILTSDRFPAAPVTTAHPHRSWVADRLAAYRDRHRARGALGPRAGATGRGAAYPHNADRRRVGQELQFRAQQD